MKTTEIKNLSRDFESAREYIEEVLKESRAADTVMTETMLIFEALCHNIYAQQENAVIAVSGRSRMGCTMIRLGFEGRIYSPENDEEEALSPEGRILTAYAEKIDYSYQAGYNRITITVRRGRQASVISCVIGMVLAIAASLPIYFLAGAEDKQFLAESILAPFESLFINAVLMIAAPVTFLSFLKHMTDIYILATRSSGARKLQKEMVLSSIAAVLLAVLTAVAILGLVRDSIAPFYHDNVIYLMSLPGWLLSLIPSNIVTPFMSISPFPLFFTAILFAWAMCYSGKHFDRLKGVIDAFYTLFSRMLSVVMYFLPVFVFAAFMDIVMRNGFSILLYLAGLILIVALSLAVLFIGYGIRLWCKKIPILPFVKKLLPLLRENWKIGSAIDAVPFNVRYCVRQYHMDQKRLKIGIPILAQINLDGNCFILTLIAIMLMDVVGRITSTTALMIMVLVFFLSLGAPNQPGSILIGMVILLNYMNAFELYSLAIICEMFFGGLLNITNVVGDIITAYIFDQRNGA
ncbi:MAG: cation:dicarboxylase symporter family transporter [Lachnospiraceae bacterium]|nr:cation:dicarboxylase symporter family transporter [Lachnospiraceae bacterium]